MCLHLRNQFHTNGTWSHLDQLGYKLPPVRKNKRRKQTAQAPKKAEKWNCVHTKYTYFLFHSKYMMAELRWLIFKQGRHNNNNCKRLCNERHLAHTMTISLFISFQHAFRSPRWPWETRRLSDTSDKEAHWFHHCLRLPAHTAESFRAATRPQYAAELCRRCFV